MFTGDCVSDALISRGSLLPNALGFTKSFFLSFIGSTFALRHIHSVQTLMGTLRSKRASVFHEHFQNLKDVQVKHIVLVDEPLGYHSQSTFTL